MYAEAYTTLMDEDAGLVTAVPDDKQVGHLPSSGQRAQPELNNKATRNDSASAVFSRRDSKGTPLPTRANSATISARGDLRQLPESSGKKLGPRAAAIATLQERAKKEADDMEAKHVRCENIKSKKEKRGTQPLTGALKARAASEQDWQLFMAAIIEWDAVEDSEGRRIQLRQSKIMARSAVERCLLRWRVSLASINKLSDATAWADLVQFFAACAVESAEHTQDVVPSQPMGEHSVPSGPHTLQGVRAAPTSCGHPSTEGAPVTSTRPQTPPRTHSNALQLRPGDLGEMRTSVANTFLAGLAKIGVTRADKIPKRLFVVVEAYDAALARANLILFDSESDAFAAVLRMGGEISQVDPVPVERIEQISLEDANVLCKSWEIPRWHRFARSKSPVGDSSTSQYECRRMPSPTNLPPPRKSTSHC